MISLCTCVCLYMCLCLCGYVCVFVYLWICLCTCVCLYMCLCLCGYVCVCVYVFVYLWVRFVPVYVFVYLWICLCTCVCLYMCLCYLWICFVPVHLFVYLWICLCTFVCLYMCLCICGYVCVPVYACICVCVSVDMFVYLCLIVYVSIYSGTFHQRSCVTRTKLTHHRTLWGGKCSAAFPQYMPHRVVFQAALTNTGSGFLRGQLWTGTLSSESQTKKFRQQPLLYFNPGLGILYITIQLYVTHLMKTRHMSQHTLMR